MPDEPLLRGKAREAILAGRMPRTKPSRTFGGTGAEKPCAVCGESIPGR
jgi:hypothetical protein